MTSGRARLEPSLIGRCVLVVEDEYFIADDLRHALEQRGAVVLGPVPDVGEAMAVLSSGPRIAAAILDIDLRGERVYALADALRARDVPFVFTTGYGPDAISEAYGDVPRWEKPYRYEDLLRTLSRLLAPV